MGLSSQQGPLGRNPNGAFLTTTPMPERMLYAEPLRRRMSVELAGGIVARTDDAVLLFEPGRYPVAYFPVGDVAAGVLQPTDRRTTHPDLGETHWFDAVRDDGEITRRAAWQHVDPPAPLAPFETMARIADLVSFEPDKVMITVDGERLAPAPSQTVVAHGPDRNLEVDELGGVELLTTATPTATAASGAA